MKIIIITLAFITTATICKSQQNFQISINGISTKTTNSKLFIDYEFGGQKITDSISIKNQSFTFKKQISQPAAAALYSDNQKIKRRQVFFGNDVVNIQLSDTSIQVNRTKLQDDFLDLISNDKIRRAYYPLYGELNAKSDTAGLKKLGVIFDSLSVDDVKKSKEYFLKNPSSILSLFAFARYSAFLGDYSIIDNDFKRLPNWAKNSPDGKNIAAKIEGAKSTQVGTPAKFFSQNSSKGQTISLSDFKGKYILLDFWASWCGPCRKGHPSLINTYNTFKTKDFEIISISLDNDKAAWLKAIEKDKIIWTQMSDLKGQQNKIALDYGVQAIPASFLINPEGKIIAKDLKGEELNKKLETLLNAHK